MNDVLGEQHIRKHLKWF